MDADRPDLPEPSVRQEQHQAGYTSHNHLIIIQINRNYKYLPKIFFAYHATLRITSFSSRAAWDNCLST